ncbi:Tyr recombinase domain-containing protein [Cupriavidus necator]|uniref:tyrosine-type recombinase/integrase n=1 Tax=Cupriavidus necator TaxID=106590 RepID=UPI003F741D6C
MSLGAQKLYAITTADCTLPIHATPNGVSRHPARDVPQLYWPDGTICWLANLYLLNGYRKGRSRKNKGGTLLTWAKNLSPLIRWCYQNKVDFIDLTESHFRMFVNVLQMEKDSELASEKKRGEPQVTNICSTVLNFLAFLDERIPGLNLLGASGRIHAEKKSFQVKSGVDGKTITRTAWVHECVPKHRKSRRRQPISTSAVNRLYDTNVSVDASPFVSRRRYVMLRLLEITGGRRIEVSFIEVSDLEAAAKTGELKIFTAKQRHDDASRLVPVSQADLKEVMSFVKHYRQRIIRKTIGTENDHGRLFIAEGSGLPLEPDTLGSELYILRRAAGIDDEEACMHAFRHRYTTNIFRDLIRVHHCQNADDLNRVLSTETLKAKVMEWTGHRSMAMLEHYIHLAFEAEANFQETMDLLKARRLIQSVRTMMKDYSAQLRNPNLKATAVVALAEMLDSASSELAGLLGNSVGEG